MAHIIFLHGASSSGKSTIARALQARLSLPFWHISIDHLRDAGVLPSDRFKSGEFDWKAARTAFFDGFHTSLAAYAQAGNNLILEHILEDETWLDQLRDLFAPFDVYFAGVHCPVDILEAREKARSDRPVGSARKDFETIHIGKTYDLEVQALDGVDHSVEAIMRGWKSGKRISDFSRKT
ncbi:chloramphenicol phosphotransferase CPT family protein [Halovulum sp. GXIMD14793]